MNNHIEQKGQVLIDKYKKLLADADKIDVRLKEYNEDV
jgi:hypothetical protein